MAAADQQAAERDLRSLTQEISLAELNLSHAQQASGGSFAFAPPITELCTACFDMFEDGSCGCEKQVRISYRL